LRGIRRNAVIVVAADGKAGINHFCRPPTYRQSLDPTVAVKKKRAAVPRPVRCLEASGRKILHSSAAAINCDCLECAIECSLLQLRGSGRIERDVGEYGLRHRVLVM